LMKYDIRKAVTNFVRCREWYYESDPSRRSTRTSFGRSSRASSERWSQEMSQERSRDLDTVEEGDASKDNTASGGRHCDQIEESPGQELAPIDEK